MSILTQIISGWPGLFYALMLWIVFHNVGIISPKFLRPALCYLFPRQRKSNYFKSLPIIQKEQVLNIPSGSRLSSLILSSVILPENKSNRSEFYALFSGSVKKLGLLFGIFIVVSFVSVSNVLAATRTASVSGNWSDPATWGGATVPVAGDEVNINSGITVTIDMDVPALKSLAISGTLQYEVSTARTMTVAEIVTINSGGIFKSAPSSSNSTITTHSLVVGGSIINNGTINFSATAGAGGTTANASGAGITFTGASNATFDFSTATLTNLRQTNGLVLNKGTTASSVLTFIPGGTFQVLSGNTDGFLTINNGTFKIIGSNAFSNPVFELLSYVIPGSGGFELSNPNAVIVGQNGSVDNNGILRISAGIYNIGSALGNSSVTNNGGTFELSGGEMNVAGRFLLSNAQGLLTGGNLNLSTIGHASATQATFQCSLTSDLTISGSATVTFIKPNTNATPFNDIEILNGSGSKSIAGGTFLLGNASTPAGSIFRINSDIPLNNLTIGTNAVAILTDDLTINQNLLVNGELQVNGNDLVLRKFLPDVELNFTEGIFNSGSAINVVSTNGIHPKNKNSTNYLNHYWTITTSNITNPKVDVTLTYSETDVVGSDSKIVTGVYKPDSKWYKYSPALTALNNLPATEIDNTSFSITGISGDPPTVTVTASPATICAGASSNLTATPVGDSPFSYLWAPATGLSSSTIANPVATPAATTNYTVTVTDGNGFTANASQIITVNPVNTISVGSSAPTVCMNSALTNITHTTTGATGIGAASGLPAGVSAAWATNAITISGTPTASGTFNYTIPLTGGCGSVNATGTITVNPVNTVSVGSSTPTVCMNSALTNITHTTTGATGIGAASGLPAGVSAVWAANTITISGTPTASGTFNYTIPLTGGCGLVNATGTITVNPVNTVSVGSSTPAVCINSALTNITHTTTGATGIGAVSGLPAGVSAAWAANTITISGTPASSGTFNYTIPLTGGCGLVDATGTITVNPVNTVSVGSSAPTLCMNSALTNITHTTTGATGIGAASGLPAGVSAAWAANTITISGTPTASGTFNYTIPLTGGCGLVNATGTITVNPLPTVTAPADQTYCMGATTLPIPLVGAPSGVIFDISGGAAIGLTNKIGVTQIPSYAATTGTATITITPRANGCTGSPVTFTVTVDPRPNIHLSASARTICSGGNTNISITSSTASATFSWVVQSMTGTITGASGGTGNLLDQTLYNNTATTGTVVYQITASAGGCEGATINLTVTVYPEVSATIAGTTTVCQNDTPAPVVTYTASGGTAPYTFTYSINSGANQQVTVASGNTATVTAPTGVSGTFVYNLVSVSGSAGCAYPQTGTATVTVNPLPTLTSSLTPPGICSNTPFNYAHVSSLLNTDFHWVREVVPGISNPREEGDNIYPDETLINTTTSPIEVVYKYTLTANGCKNTQYVKVMVTQSPVLTSTLTPAPICSGTLFSYIPTSNINPGTTFSWTRAADSYGNSAKSGTGNPNEILYNNSTSTISVIYHYSLSSNGCTNPTDFQVVVPVVPAPVVWANASPTPVCSGKPVALSSGSNIVSGLPTTILTQDFNGAVSGWTANSAGSGTWQILNSLNIGGGNQITNGGSKFYVSDMRSANTTSTLTRSVFINTQGYQTVTMTFDHYYRDNNSSVATVRWSSDGISWPNSNILATYDSNRGTRNNFTNETVNIPVGQPKVYIRFSYQANNDYYWAIDDVSITGVPQATATILWTSNKSSWTSTQKDVSVSPTETTIYTATYTDQATGCSGSASTTVTVYPTPDATIHADYCVASPKIRLTTGAFSTYSWSPLPLGETNGKQYIDIDIAGIYTVNVTDANGCAGTASINVSNEYVDNGDFSAGNTGFVTPATGGNQYTYVANGAGNTELWPEGLYGIGTNANDYHSNFWGIDHTTGTGKFMIVNGFPGAPQPIVWQQTIDNLLPNTDYYFSAWAISLNSVGNDAQLRFSINGTQLGTIADLTTIPGVSNSSNSWHDEGRFYGVWNSGSNTSAILSIVDLQTAPSGNDFGLDDISFGILDPSPAKINPSKSGDVCAGESINLHANVTGGKEPILFSWTGPNGYTSHDRDPVIPNATIAYSGTYTLTVSDWYGCAIAPETVDVVVYPAPTVNAGPDQLYGCSATSVFTLNGSVGGSATSGTWTTSGDGTFDDIHSMTAKYTIGAADIANGTVTLTLTTDDPTGPCIPVKDDMIITIHRSPELTVVVANPLCAGYSDGSATASVTNGTAPYTYLWSNGKTTAKVTGLADGTYTVTVTDANNCTDTETITVIEPTALVVSPASFTPPTCYGGNDGTATVNAEGGTEPYVYQWDAATGNQTTKTATGLKVGTYLFTVTDANGCNITSDFVLVTQPDPPTLDCPDDPDPVLVTGGATSAPVILTDPSYDPVCQILSWTMSGATVVSTPVAGTVPSPYTFNVGTTVVTYSAVNVANEVLTCSFNVVVIGGADLAITKTANPSPVNTGDPLVYTITVTNAGPAEATLVKIADVVAVLPSPEFTTDLVNGPWNPWVTPYDAGNIAKGGVTTIYIRGTVPVKQCADIDNTATVTSNTNDPVLANNQVTITTPVIDNKPPTFTAPGPFDECVEHLFSAVYNGAGNVDLNLDYVPDYPNPYPKGDYYLFRSGSELLNLDLSAINYKDNCCAEADGYSIRWEIDFDGSEPSVSGFGQPSTYTDPISGLPVDIKLWGDGVTFNSRVHDITYWITDCHGNESDPVTTTITIKPRPKIIKMN